MEPIGSLFDHSRQVGPSFRLGNGLSTSPFSSTTDKSQSPIAHVAAPENNRLEPHTPETDVAESQKPLRVFDVLNTLNRAFNSGPSANGSGVSAFLNELLANEGGFGGLDGLGEAVETEISAQTALERSLSFTLVTQEGDEVEVSLSSFQSAAFQSYESGGGYAEQRAFESQRLFEFSVSGHLNEEEISGLDQFVEKLSTSVQSFFEEGIDSALSSLKGLSFDSSVISGYQLSLEASAVATYERVQTYVVDAQSLPSLLNSSSIAQSYQATQSYFEQVMENAQSLPEQLLGEYLNLLLPAIEQVDAQQRAQVEEEAA